MNRYCTICSSNSILGYHNENFIHLPSWACIYDIQRCPTPFRVFAQSSKVQVSWKQYFRASNRCRHEPGHTMTRKSPLLMYNMISRKCRTWPEGAGRRGSSQFSVDTVGDESDVSCPVQCRLFLSCRSNSLHVTTHLPPILKLLSFGSQALQSCRYSSRQNLIARSSEMYNFVWKAAALLGALFFHILVAGSDLVLSRANAVQSSAEITQGHFDRELRRQLSKDASIYLSRSPQFGNLVCQSYISLVPDHGNDALHHV